MTRGRRRVVVAGAGLVGLATARALLRCVWDLSVVVVEKEPSPARHQSGRNSGVVHSGVYYRPGSHKARLCVAGARRMLAYCAEHGVPHLVCGKVIVATNDREGAILEELLARGRANGVPGVRRLLPEELAGIEPHARGVAALHVPGTAVCDFGGVARALAREIEEVGGTVCTSEEVVGCERAAGEVGVRTTERTIHADLLVTCGGLHADRLARMDGVDASLRVVPFRGEYRRLAAPSANYVRGLIYPTPDPRLPFLGVHLTRDVHGTVEAGPGAVLALAREGYRWRDAHWRDLREMLGYRGFWRMAARYPGTGIAEVVRSLSRTAFARAVRRLVPEVRARDLLPGSAGVRAQAVTADGSLVDDFVVGEGACGVHVLNAPSPAATASLAIGRHVADLALARLGVRARLSNPEEP